jgi:hypothetical protein
MILTGQQIVTSALHRLGALRFGQTTSPDIGSGGLGVLNEMIDGWLLDELKVFAITPQVYTLTTALVYTIGPTGDFTAVRPTRIVDANYLFSTNPVVRKPVAILSEHDWSLIGVQNIPGALINALWYDYGVSQPSGNGTIHVWPGPKAGDQLELFTWQQLLSFPDLTTPITFPPGYPEAMKWCLAEQMIPMVRVKPYVTLVQETLNTVRSEAQKARTMIEGYNHIPLMTECDSSFLIHSRRGAFNYLTGTFGIGL